MESIATPDNAHGKETYCHCEDESIGRYVAFGSQAVIPRPQRERLFLGVEQTKSPRKRTSTRSPLEPPQRVTDAQVRF